MTHKQKIEMTEEEKIDSYGWKKCSPETMFTQEDTLAVLLTGEKPEEVSVWTNQSPCTSVLVDGIRWYFNNETNSYSNISPELKERIKK